MAYGIKYRLEFLDEYDRWKRVDVLQDGYTGETITEKAGVGFSPLSISIQGQGDEKYTTVKPTEISLSLYSDNFEFQQITEATDTEFLLKVYEAPTENGPLSLKHIGYVIPEIYGEPYTVAPYGVTIKATSLGILKNIRYLNSGSFYTGEATLMTILTRCLNELDYQIDIWDSVNMFEDSQSDITDSPLNNIKIDQEAFIFDDKGTKKAKTCLQIIEDILKPLNVNFFQDYGRWVIVPMELRATQREVREYDYQGTFIQTSNYNPLNENYNWINQDQNLEFRPKAKEVNIIYNHGLPNDAVGNADFNDDFTTESVTDDTIEVPNEWAVNDLADFTAFGFLQGCREVSAPNDENGPQAVALDSDFIADGAYIEYDGTKYIDADATDQLLFKVRYAGSAYERNSDDSDPTYVQPTYDPTLTIDHKFQIKLGTYYLTAEGEWTTTATDIVVNDLGDAVSGCSTLETRDLGIASGFRTFEIPSVAIPEDGTVRVRIYKPISQNEGQFVGDSIAKCAYSLFSLIVYPDGEPPEEETEFTEEKSVAVYSDSIDYEINHGDGPTNLHLASYLEDSSGNLIKTNSWTRGAFTGTLPEVLTDSLFLEYENQSWLIRGTQKVRGLFDRWFFEYGKAYTPLSGTYDERLCRFNGELIQIQNAEIDEFGEELPAPTNFSVDSTFPPTYDPEDDDIYYLITPNYSLSDTYFSVLKKEVDTVAGSTSVLNSYDIDLSSYGLSSDDINDAMIAMRWDKNIVTVVTTTEGYLIQVFDPDLNLLHDVVLLQTIYSLGDAYEPRDIALDYDGSIYMTWQRDAEFLTRIKTRKYDSELNLVWTSAEYPDNPPNDEPTSGSPNAIRTGVTEKYIAVIYGDSGLNAFGHNTIQWIDKNTGSLVEQIGDTGYSSGFLAANIWNFEDGKFVLQQSDSNGDTIIKYYDEDRNQIGSANVYSDDTAGDLSNRADVAVEGEFAFSSGFGGFVVFERDTYDSATGSIGSGAVYHLGKRSVKNEFLSFYSSSIYLVDATDLNSITDTFIVTDGDFWTSKEEFSATASPQNDSLSTGFNNLSPNIENVVLSASPSTDTVPFTSTITFGADNSGDADVTLNLLFDGSVVDSLTIPAGTTGISSTHDQLIENPDTYTVEFAGSSISITANGNTVTGGSEGWIDIESAADADTVAVAPTTKVDVVNEPSSASDACSGSGTNKTNVQWESTDYCFDLPNDNKSVVATTLNSHFNTSVTGLSSTTSTSPSGYPRLNIESDTDGTTDNGKSVILEIPTAIEGNGPIFSKYTLDLTGGVDAYTLSEEIDILIGGAVFATTSAITSEETAANIAQAIFDACDAVGSSTYDFALNGTRVLVGSTGGAETLSLDIKNAGFEFSTRDIQ